MIAVSSSKRTHADSSMNVDTGALSVLGRILIVDDVTDNREILKRRLVKRGYFVVEATCGREAIDVIGQQEFDLVLLDVRSPANLSPRGAFIALKVSPPVIGSG